ncbi:hypothetical protein V8E54_003408 [Elaphomyces granulatus]
MRNAGRLPASYIQYTPFRQRLYLVAIDEMHLCAQISWGGSFRPAFSQLSKLRDQLEPNSTRLFGTTATLRPDTWKEIRETAGFRPETQPMRTSIYRSDVYLYMHPTDEPRTMYKRILFTALEGCTDERLIPKMIFFVHDVRETTELRALLVLNFDWGGSCSIQLQGLTMGS